MPRQPRQKSFTGVYHIMLRGNEKKNIFNDDVDRHRFIEILSGKMILSQYDIYAYCLMSNHVHLLMKENVENIDLCLKRINVSYVSYFNKKYSRVGHLFQDRFKSECIETEEYLLAAVRYIHNNPVKAGIVTNPGDFPWSSYRTYINGSLYDFVDKRRILDLFSQNTSRAIKDFVEFSDRGDDDSFIDYDGEGHDDIFIRNAEEALRFIDVFLTDKKISFQELMSKENIADRDHLICLLKAYSKLTVRAISKILNINRGIVQRAKMG